MSSTSMQWAYDLELSVFMSYQKIDRYSCYGCHRFLHPRASRYSCQEEHDARDNVKDPTQGSYGKVLPRSKYIVTLIIDLKKASWLHVFFLSDREWDNE